ncbi:MAG TPA: hypothetical protein VFW87_15605 [Pirellulales bacterium]|nr:hypothetical protein [Pirellulales bacterium]
MNWLVAEQLRRNAARRDAWSGYAAHRAETTARIVAAARSQNDQLCLLGAGNGDDLDLAEIASVYSQANLADIDADALARGLDRLPASQRQSFRLHGGIDLTGCWQYLGNRPRGDAPTDAELEQVIQCCAADRPPPLPGPFDVVASTCVISQLIDSAVLALGPAHPRLLEVVLPLRTNHLRLMAGLLAPGGRAVLITDFVSSDSLPELLTDSEPDWPALLAKITARGNFFHGLNPCNLLAVFQADRVLAATVIDARLTGLWRWRQAKRVYAVAAIEFQT